MSKPLAFDVKLVDAEAFWRKVDKDGPVPTCRPELGQCWIWNGSPAARGYGRAYVIVGGRRRHRFAHRIASALAGFELVNDKVLDHLCRNTSCVRPTHLEQVTQAVNVMRGDSPCAAFAAATHCKYGHEFTPDNVIPGKGSHRNCKLCMRRRGRAPDRMERLRFLKRLKLGWSVEDALTRPVRSMREYRHKQKASVA